MITPPLLAPLDESKIKPVRVMVTMMLDERDALKVVITIEVRKGELAKPDAPPLMATTELFPIAKNSDGNIKVMVLPGIKAPPLDGVKEKVTAAIVLLINRPEPAMTNTPIETRLPIMPVEMASDRSGSALVVTTISSCCPIDTGPMVSP
jgi:hypothetical protein